jgi:two-component system response regulator AtoC
MGQTGRVLLVDDDPAIGTVLTALLKQGGLGAMWADSAETALGLLARHDFDVVLSDVKMPGLDGLGLLDRLAQERPDVPVVLLTAHGTVPMAVDAMKRGAADFLLKPFDSDEVLFVLRKALALATSAATRDRPPSKALVGTSPAMRKLDELVRRAARGTATVLIRGESGTGKELVARAVHDTGSRSEGPFVKLNCAALPEALLESELFGYEKGAFTGAATRKPGRIELAHGGTLFLDEIGDIPLGMQVKLLGVLQERQFERLGGCETLRVDVRFVAATHRDIESLVARGHFREDLFYRLNVLPVWLPALRERSGDVVLLAEHFCAVHARANGRPNITLTPDALTLLAAQPWPGNVRQLENFIERLVVLADGLSVSRADVELQLRGEVPIIRDELPTFAPRNNAAEMSLDDSRRQSERDALTAALVRSGNNRTLAARLLGISRRTLYTKLDYYGLI